jgi:hypothetical protein
MFLSNPAISTTIMFVRFYLWVFCGSVYIFALIIKFLNDTLVPMHVIMGLFEMNEMTRQSMAT